MANKVLASLSALLTLNPKGFEDGLNRSKKSAGAFQKSISAIGPAIAAAFSTYAIINFARTSAQAYDKQQKAEAKIMQAVKQTGGAAGYTADQLKKMASELQKVTIFGDEQILNDVTAQLLSFPQITGKAFADAQRAAMDLATLIDGDLKASSIALGKALADPVRGVTALRRMGVLFTETQQEHIANLVEQNKLYEAQELILKEINNQYGGQAEAAAKVGLGALQQLKNAWGDFKEEMFAAAASDKSGGLFGWLKESVEYMTWGLNKIRSDGNKFIDWWHWFWQTGPFSPEAYEEAQKRAKFDAEVQEMMAQAYKDADKWAGKVSETTSGYADALDSVAVSAGDAAANLRDFQDAMYDSIGPNQSQPLPGGITSAQVDPNAKGRPIVSDAELERLTAYMDKLKEVEVAESAFTDAHAGFAERMIVVNEQMAQSMAQSFDLIAASFGDAVADFVTGEKTFDEAMRSFANSLIRIAIQLMTTFLAQTIGAAMSHGAAKGGAVGSIVEGGAAAAAFGAMIPALQFLADGGIAYGPTPALIGEYPGASTNPEVVAPLSDLENMIGGGGPVELHGKFRIEGSDLVYIVNKENSKLDRYR